MSSDEQRREIAQKLREACDEIERTGNGLTVWELTDILDIRDDDSGMIEGLNLDDARNIADLIDVPTCAMTNVGGDFENSFQCSNCMNEFDMPDYDRYPYKRCPECGAVVIPFQYE